MKYCDRCGAELADDAIKCTNCNADVLGVITQEDINKRNAKLKEIALYVMLGKSILVTISLILGIFLNYIFFQPENVECAGVLFLVGIESVWIIPTMIGFYRWNKKEKPINFIFKLYVLIAVSRAAGVILLCAKEEPKEKIKKNHNPKTIILNTIAIIGITAYISVLGFFLINPIYSSYKVYNNGVAEMESGNFERAKMYFRQSGSFKNSIKLYMFCDSMSSAQELKKKQPYDCDSIITKLTLSTCKVNLHFYAEGGRIEKEELVVDLSGTFENDAIRDLDYFVGWWVHDIDYKIDSKTDVPEFVVNLKAEYKDRQQLIINNEDNIIYQKKVVSTVDSKYNDVDNNIYVIGERLTFTSDKNNMWTLNGEIINVGKSCAFTIKDETQSLSIKPYVEGTYVLGENQIWFGEYPQNQLINYDTIEQLNNKVMPLPNESELNGWNTYSFAQMHFSDILDISTLGYIDYYVYYIDVDADEDGFNDYRGLFYRVTNPFTNFNADLNGFTPEKIYWFEYEPIKWNILEQKDNKVLIISSLILDAHEFGSDNTNDYELSDIKQWLNGTFYNTAFSQYQKNMISGSDNIFILSKEEVTTYSSQLQSSNGTDYAFHNGLSLTSWNNNHMWITRTIKDSNHVYGWDSGWFGEVHKEDHGNGICPVCYIDIADLAE